MDEQTETSFEDLKEKLKDLPGEEIMEIFCRSDETNFHNELIKQIKNILSPMVHLFSILSAVCLSIDPDISAKNKAIQNILTEEINSFPNEKIYELQKIIAARVILLNTRTSELYKNKR
ncbi:MAG: hypothetical protein KKC46_13635 [Proteobacteria bacterium]|nr:hypothetical protein [Pseudomonadota bacterium]